MLINNNLKQDLKSNLKQTILQQQQKKDLFKIM